LRSAASSAAPATTPSEAEPPTTCWTEAAARRSSRSPSCAARKTKDPACGGDFSARKSAGGRQRPVRLMLTLFKYPLGESNPCPLAENQISWATRRRGRSGLANYQPEPPQRQAPLSALVDASCGARRFGVFTISAARDHRPPTEAGPRAFV